MNRFCAVLLTCLLALAACNDASSPPGGNGGPAAVPDNPAAQPDDAAPLPVGMAVTNAPLYPTRIAVGADGKTYVSDAQVGAVFVLDARLRTVGQLKGLKAPLGVAVDVSGRIYVGSDSRDCVDVYSPGGERLATIGEGLLQMPNDLAIDEAGNLYVVDSRANAVVVFDPDGKLLRTIGAGQLAFPSAIAIADGEVFVADQGHFQVQVFDTNGIHQRSFGAAVEAFTNEWQGRFVKLQGLAVDSQGRLHAVDSYQNNVQILDARTGAYLDSYAMSAAGEGTLTLPLDIALNAAGDALVANAESRRVESFRAVAAPLTEGE